MVLCSFRAADKDTHGLLFGGVGTCSDTQPSDIGHISSSKCFRFVFLGCVYLVTTAGPLGIGEFATNNPSNGATGMNHAHI